jgi:hypothetical protein
MSSVPLVQILLANRVPQDFWVVEKFSYISTFGISVSGIKNGNLESLFGTNCGDHELISL